MKTVKWSTQCVFFTGAILTAMDQVNTSKAQRFSTPRITRFSTFCERVPTLGPMPNRLNMHSYPKSNSNGPNHAITEGPNKRNTLYLSISSGLARDHLSKKSSHPALQPCYIVDAMGPSSSDTQDRSPLEASSNVLAKKTNDFEFLVARFSECDPSQHMICACSNFKGAPFFSSSAQQV